MLPIRVIPYILVSLRLLSIYMNVSLFFHKILDFNEFSKYCNGVKRHKSLYHIEREMFSHEGQCVLFRGVHS